jgi:transposase
MSKAKRDIKRNLRVLNHAKQIGNIRKTCRYFVVSRAIFYGWRNAYDQFGEEGLINKKPCPENRALRMPVEIEEKILYIRKTYHLGPERITWYLKRYHDITLSGRGVYRALKRNGYNRFSRNAKRRTDQIVR